MSYLPGMAAFGMALSLLVIVISMGHNINEQARIQREQATNIRAIYNCIGNPHYAGVTPHDESTLIRQCMDDVRGR